LSFQNAASRCRTLGGTGGLPVDWRDGDHVPDFLTKRVVEFIAEFDHWLDGIRQRDAFGHDNVPETVSPFAKVQSISAVYFPQFSELIRELEIASTQYRFWIHTAEIRRVTNSLIQISDGFNEAHGPYVQKREALLKALQKFAHDEFQ
jgi:hypothetical protein